MFSQQHNVVLNDLSMAENVDFIFCVNDIKPVLKTKKVPIVTWIGERPSYPYLNQVLKLRQSDLIFITDKTFVDEVKTIVGHNNVYYLPLATSFSKEKIPLNYTYEISFVGNTMQKQFQSIESQEEMIFKLPLRDMGYDNIKKIIMSQCMETLLINVEQFIDSFSILQQYCNKMEEISKFKKDIFLGYVGMVITYTIRKNILEELAKEYSKMVAIPSIWRNEIKGICIHNKIPYENINKWYNNCKMNLNISSRHMPTALNSRVFDVPICGSFLEHWFGRKCFEVSKDFYNRSIQSCEEGYTNLFQLELHDLIIYQQMHFIQHFYKNIWDGFCSGVFYIQKKVNLLFELAVIITREWEQISWDYYCALCHGYEIDMEIAAVCKYVNQIFGEVIPENVIEKLVRNSYCYSKPLFYDCLCRYHLTKKFSDILQEPEINQMCEFTKEVYLKKIGYICALQVDESVPFRLCYDMENMKNYVIGSEMIANNMEVIIRYNWDEEHLHLYIYPQYRKHSVLELMESAQRFQRDRIAIILHNYEKELIVKRIDMQFNGRIIENRHGIADIQSKINVGQSFMQVSFSWKALDIIPQNNSGFGFNFEWDHYEDNEPACTRLSISGNPCWHDIVGLAKIELHIGASK